MRIFNRVLRNPAKKPAGTISAKKAAETNKGQHFFPKVVDFAETSTREAGKDLGKDLVTGGWFSSYYCYSGRETSFICRGTDIHFYTKS